MDNDASFFGWNFPFKLSFINNTFGIVNAQRSLYDVVIEFFYSVPNLK